MQAPLIEGLKSLTWTTVRFVLKLHNAFVWHKFPGAALRDEFGRVLKDSVCVWSPGECSCCLLQASCAYPQLFAPGPPPGTQRLRNLSDIPRPFVIEPLDTGFPPDSVGPAGRIEFRLLLVGRAIEQLPYFIFMFQKMGRDGFGPSRATFSVNEVVCETSEDRLPLYRAGDLQLRGQPFRLTVRDLAGRIERERTRAHRSPRPIGLRVSFLSPTEIRRDGKPCRKVSLADLVRSLLRRLSNLAYFHCGGELPIDFPAIIDLAERCPVRTSELRWQSQHRNSGSQRRRIPMGGLTGSIDFYLPEPETLELLLPYLILGETFHVGKGCVMGLGRYEVSIIAGAPDERLP